MQSMQYPAVARHASQGLKMSSCCSDVGCCRESPAHLLGKSKDVWMLMLRTELFGWKTGVVAQEQSKYLSRVHSLLPTLFEALFLPKPSGGAEELLPGRRGDLCVWNIRKSRSAFA